MHNKFVKKDYLKIGNYNLGIIIYPIHKYNLYLCFLLNKKSKGIYLF